MNLAIAYPRISDADYDWIQDIRRHYDPTYFNVVEPHFTLVFGTDKLSISEFTEHVRSKLVGNNPIKFILDRTQVIEDDSKKFFHTFLVPSEGYKEIVALHDKLYSDQLRSELRLDIPFIPHVGIGTSTDEGAMQKLAVDINRQNRIIKGEINKISIVQHDGSKVTDHEELLLIY